MITRTRLVRAAILIGAVALPALAVEAASRTRTVARPYTCQNELGPSRAADLANQCLLVSPGRAACNPTNTCATVADEVRKGCLNADDDDAFPFCTAYNVDRDEED